MQRVMTFLAMFQRERQAGDLAFAVGFFVFAVFMAAMMPSQAKFLGNKSIVAEPGFWPLVAVCMMVLFGAFHLLSTYNAPRLPGRLAEVITWARSVEFVAWFAVYVLAVPWMGYLPATLGFAALLTYRLGYRSGRMMGAALAFALLVVLVFKTGLGVRLPSGALYAYLPDSIRSFVMVNF